MGMTCYECGETGHFQADCPNITYVRGTGETWCGSCDETTRLVDLGDKMRHCPDCHPLRGQHLRQHRNCPSCHAVIYVWDHAPCAQHQLVGIQREHVDLAARKPVKDLRALALEQVAESRAARPLV